MYVTFKYTETIGSIPLSQSLFAQVRGHRIYRCLQGIFGELRYMATEFTNVCRVALNGLHCIKKSIKMRREEAKQQGKSLRNRYTKTSVEKWTK